MRRLLGALSLVVLVRCGTVVDHHVVTLSVHDPSRRLGVIEAAIVERTSSEALKDSALSQLAAVPLRREVTGTRVVAGLSRGDAPVVTFGVVVPKLSPDGYFLLELKPEQNVEKSERVPLVRFGQFFAEEGAVTVPVRYSGKAGDRGWLLDVKIDVPMTSER